MRDALFAAQARPFRLINASPGGTISAFCEAVMTGVHPPVGGLEIHGAEGRYRIHQEQRRMDPATPAYGWMSFSTPVDVSWWVTNTPLILCSRSSARRASTAAGSTARPRGTLIFWTSSPKVEAISAKRSPKTPMDTARTL
ncbi:MAG TPA: hypothetical protein VGL40_10390 [Bacillota bacterium]